MDQKKRDDGFILIALLTLAAVGMVFVDSMMSSIRVNTISQSDSTDEIRATYLANAALHEGFAEVAAQEDLDVDGLGAIGVGNPRVLRDARGAVIGEYVSFVQYIGDNNVLTGVAAIPNFAAPTAIHSSRAIVNAEVEFILKPSSGALAISGPLNNPNMSGMSTGGFQITGDGDTPAIVLSNAAAHEAFMDEMIHELDDGDWDGTEVTGTAETYTALDGTEYNWPIGYREKSFLTADDLNTYRNDLRAHFEEMADSADRLVSDKVYGDHAWGTTASPEVTVIDCDLAGTTRVFRTEDQTITGSGTLIIKHTIKHRYNLNFNWDGDVVIIGYDGDGSDLLYTYGSNMTINGNLILLAGDTTEASFEIADSVSSYVGGGDERKSLITVNGGVLCLAEAGSHETEIEVEDSSELHVNGFVGMYGSRVEIEANSGTVLNVTGTFAAGLPDSGRSDDFFFQLSGDVNLAYDKTIAEDAINGLTELQADVDLSGSTGGVTYNKFMFTAAISSEAGSSISDLAMYHQLMGAGAEMGVDMDSIAVPESTTP